MQEMLRRLAEQDHYGETIRRILAAFPEADKIWLAGKAQRSLRAIHHPVFRRWLSP